MNERRIEGEVSRVNDSRNNSHEDLTYNITQMGGHRYICSGRHNLTRDVRECDGHGVKSRQLTWRVWLNELKDGAEEELSIQFNHFPVPIFGLV